jgi:predicted NBD/HSP70 family sugar kinase
VRLVTSSERASGAVNILRAAHTRPGVSRAALGAELGIRSGFLAEIVARLAALDLLAERPAPATGERGRPTTTLVAHPRGPLVLAASIAQERWRAAVYELGSHELAGMEQAHAGNDQAVLADLGAAIRALVRRYGRRVRVISVAVPGTVRDGVLAQAANLGWDDVDLTGLRPTGRSGRLFLAGNDATLSAVAESIRGGGAGHGSLLHLYLEAGVGGALIEGGLVVGGSTGTAGEFGHMPFGDAALVCRCGARGCWNTSIEGAAIARALGQDPPGDEVSYSRQVIATAATHPHGPERRVIDEVARSLGRGVAGLVNALDPAVVIVGGLGRELFPVAADALYPSYLAGLMHFRAGSPPPVLPAELGAEAPLLGAAEEAFAAVLSEEGLAGWSAA